MRVVVLWIEGRVAVRLSVVWALVVGCASCDSGDDRVERIGSVGPAGSGGSAASAGLSSGRGGAGAGGAAGVAGAAAAGGGANGSAAGAGNGVGAAGGGAGGASTGGTGGGATAGAGGAGAGGASGAGTGGAGGSGAGGSGGGGVSGGNTATCDLPATFKWSSSGVLVAPKSNASHALVSVKDPTIVWHEGRYQVYATVANTAGAWNMVHFSFTDFASAGAAPHYYMDATPGFSGYHCAPNLFYFQPDGLWYLVQQSQPPQYSTSADPSDPSSWTAPRYFYPNGNHLPAGAPSLPIDYWVICDDQKCHLFFTGDDGSLYRAETAIDDFPAGFGALETVMTQGKFELFEGSAHYKVKGRNQYLTIIEAIGGRGRYYRSWTATSLEGPWTPLAATEEKPFAGAANVTYEQGIADWTDDVSHGEIIRDGVDQTMTIDACDLRFLYQGRNPASGGEYSQLPYRLGLLTFER